MAKNTYKPLAYIEPPPTTESSPPGRGVWSVAPDITAVDNTRDALRQAIYDAIHRFAPDVAESLAERGTPGEMSFDVWADMWVSRVHARRHKSPFRLMTLWWQTRQILRATGHESLSEDPEPSRHLITGTAELHVENSWRFNPSYQPREVVRAGILDNLTREVDHELAARYSEVERMRPRPFSRPNLERDATRLVLRRFLGLTDDYIKDCEAGYEVTLDSGRTIACPRPDPETEEQDLLDPEAEMRERGAIDKSIKNLERAAGITFPPRKRGRRPKQPPADDPNREYLG